MDSFQRYSQFRAARARSLAACFDRFIDREIGIAAGSREAASASQNALRDYLRSLAGDDAGFPRILRTADSDFLGGSFARHTKIWPLDDIDVYFPIDATGLVYTHRGTPAPYTALSDAVLEQNPLLEDLDRWWDGPNLSSKKLIIGFREALRGNYPLTTRVRSGGEAVTVTLANELGFDVVPCFSLAPHDAGEKPFYLIPDGYDGWIQTNPRLDQELSGRLHRVNNQTLRPAVKLFKWWAEEFLGGRVESYYAELAIMRAFQRQNRIGRYVQTVSEATLLAFEAVRDAIQSGEQQPLLAGSPPVKSNEVTSQDLQVLNYDVQNCHTAFRSEHADRIEDALASWKTVFGNKFPVD